ncbi:hypothetical protein EVAR_19371_1 [Eumeta japonica]|uniref:Uncharacterized protein n=1 Tax=Eumeta variegata TaxID=151549 RepID=A0A4C1TRN6_EUMVA|nr:hypothetical protein EVAR_19371_1 [Eumeta japonica]
MIGLESGIESNVALKLKPEVGKLIIRVTVLRSDRTARTHSAATLFTVGELGPPRVASALVRRVALHRLLLPPPLSVGYPIPSEKAGNALVTPRGLPASPGGHHHIIL